MDTRTISIALFESVGNFDNLLRSINVERTKMEDSNLTERQFFALSAIRKYDKIELKNLSKNLSVSTSSLCILLNKLVDQGYVAREQDKKDRRNTFYSITEEGLVILKKENHKLLDILSSKLENLNSESKSELYKNINSINIIMRELL